MQHGWYAKTSIPFLEPVCDFSFSIMSELNYLIPVFIY